MSSKSPQTILTLCESATEEAVRILGATLLSVSLFGNDDTQNRLVGNAPGLLFVVQDKSPEVLTKLQSLNLPSSLSERVHLLFFTKSEMQSLEYESPLELLLIKTENSTLFGFDIPPMVEIKMDYLQGHIIRELRTVSIQMRSSLLRDVPELYPSRIAAAMSRLYISLKGILYLRGNSKFTGWSWLVSSIESSCNLKELIFSSVVSALESKNEQELQRLFIPFIDTVDQLLVTISELKVER